MQEPYGFDEQPVLVEAAVAGCTPAVADADRDHDSPELSAVGDTPDPSDAEQAALRQQASAWGIRSLTLSEAGDTTDGQRRSSRWNKEPEVGNFGLMFGNWGKRQEDNSNKSSQAAPRRMHENADRQILKKPCACGVLGGSDRTS